MNKRVARRRATQQSRARQAVLVAKKEVVRGTQCGAARRQRHVGGTICARATRTQAYGER